ncbi:MAG: PAS domain S-box protein, partial [Nitrospiria bacterium]
MKVPSQTDVQRLVAGITDTAAREWADETHARLMAILDFSDDAIITKTLDGIVTSWNRAAQRIFGYTEAEAVGQHISFIIPSDRLREEDDVLARLRNDETIEHFETVRRSRDGHLVNILLTVSPIKDTRGRMIGAAKVARDITRRKKTEASLRETQARLKAVVHNAPVTLFALDRDGALTFAEGQSLMAAADLSSSAMLGRSALEIFRDVPWIAENIRRASKGEAFWDTGEVGDQWFEAHWAPLRDEAEGIAGVIGVALNVTDRKRAEDEMVRASKLESIGILGGGIAHDFNNILTAIVGNLTLAKMYLHPDHKVFRRLAESEKAALRAQTLTQQLLTFSKGGAPIKRQLAIADLLPESAEFALQGSNVRCEVSLPADLWPVEADEGQIHQVITNLVLNAQQAMPNGGVILIRAENVSATNDAPLPVPHGEYVRVTVTDHGAGIPSELLVKIFDPFFTTKPKGSGLGLTSAYWILKRHGGHLCAESTPGAGSSFFLYLPRSTKTSHPSHTSESSAVHGNGRILFMDDEAPIREFAEEFLSHLGYEIECSEDGDDAIERFNRARDVGRPFA